MQFYVPYFFYCNRGHTPHLEDFLERWNMIEFIIGIYCDWEWHWRTLFIWKKIVYQVEAVIHFEDDTEELQQWDQQVIICLKCMASHMSFINIP